MTEPDPREPDPDVPAEQQEYACCGDPDSPSVDPDGEG